MAITQISHDPFARTTLERRKTQYDFQSCKWCGQRARFEYRVISDAFAGYAQTGGWSKPFCSISCYRTYSE